MYILYALYKDIISIKDIVPKYISHKHSVLDFKAEPLK